MQETRQNTHIDNSEEINENKYTNKSRIISVIIIIIAVISLISLLYFGTGKEPAENIASAPSPEMTSAVTPSPEGTTTPSPEVTITPSPAPTSVITDDANLTKALIAGNGNAEDKVAYLTFDDGPSVNTEMILDALRLYNAKATFFVTGTEIEKHPEILKKLYDEGHSIGNHSYSHKYDTVYGTPETFLDEIKKNDELIGSIIGNENVLRLFRFPGGSFGEERKIFRETAEKAGYKYVDWNALNSDSDGEDFSAERCLEEIKSYCTDTGNVIILMHDAAAKTITAETLPQVMDFLISQGYRFERIIP